MEINFFVLVAKVSKPAVSTAITMSKKQYFLCVMEADRFIDLSKHEISISWFFGGRKDLCTTCNRFGVNVPQFQSFYEMFEGFPEPVIETTKYENIGSIMSGLRLFFMNINAFHFFM